MKTAITIKESEKIYPVLPFILQTPNFKYYMAIRDIIKNKIRLISPDNGELYSDEYDNVKSLLEYKSECKIVNSELIINSI